MEICDENELIAWLEQDDQSSRPYRAARLRLLLKEYGAEGVRVFPGGFVSAIAFEEARQAYLHGLFVACAVMCQVCVEHMLVGLFRLEGRNDLDRASFETILREARNSGHLSEQEFQLFDRLREIRNPYTHYRSPVHGDSVERRAIGSDTPVEDIIVQDAKLAIITLLRLCRRPPFAFCDSARP